MQPTWRLSFIAIILHICCAGYAGVVEIVQSKVEELALDAQVDVLVSEPMGTLLVNERMLETYLYARNRYLKKGGRMFPVSKALRTLPAPLLAHAGRLYVLLLWIPQAIWPAWCYCMCCCMCGC